MEIFRYGADRRPIALIGLFFVLNLAIWAFVDSPLVHAVWLLLAFVPRGGICAFNHHHQHLPVFRYAVPNRLLDLVYGLQTGMTSHGWVLHHSLGHHVHYLDQAKDESRWRRDDGSRMHEIEYGLVVGVTAYPRMLQVARRFPRYLRVFVVMTVLTLAIVAVLFALRPVPTVFAFVLPMVFMLFHTAWATYTHHAGKKTSSHFVASNNILHRGYNVLTGNLGYHTAHHLRPGVHWSELPALHDTIAERIPADCYLSPGLPWNFQQRVVGPPPGMPFAPGTSTEEDLESPVAGAALARE
jgi:fatty acid desaturase